MKVRILKPVFLGAVVPAGTEKEISEDDYSRFGSEYFELLEEGNDSHGDADRTENPPKSARRSARSKT